MCFASLFATVSTPLLLPTIIASPVTSPLAPADLTRRGQLLQRDVSAHDLYLKGDDDHEIWGAVENIFGAINDNPDEILEKGDEETDKWMVEHGYRSRQDKREGLDRDREDRNFIDVAKCAGAIAAFIASNAIAAAKLLRIKKYIEALGGVKASAELLLKASTNAERLKEGGEALALLAGEILGFSLISNSC